MKITRNNKTEEAPSYFELETLHIAGKHAVNNGEKEWLRDDQFTSKYVLSIFKRVDSPMRQKWKLAG